MFTVDLLVKRLLAEGGSQASSWLLGQVADLAGEELRARLKLLGASDRMAAELLKAAEAADGCFQRECTNPTLRSAMQMLPLAGTDSLQTSLNALPKSLDEDSLQQAVARLFAEGWPNLAESQHAEATRIYMDCLRLALLKVQGYREEVIGRSVLRTEEDVKKLGIRVDALPPQGVFLPLDEFKAALERHSRDLPFSVELIGREPDTNRAIDLIKNRTRILVVDGKPGVGKTRFCLELAHELGSLASFADCEVRCVKETPPNLWEAMQTELETSRRYMLVVDDANRISQLPVLRRLFTDPNRPEGSLLIANARSYSRDAVVNEFQRADFSGVESLTLRRLSNADIDTLLQKEPFNLEDRELRKPIVLMAKGNPRMAAVAAMAARRGESVAGGSLPTLYRAYFDGVFSELKQRLEDRAKHGALLATIAALRFVYLSDDNLELLTRGIGFTDVREMREAVAYLEATEVLDLSLYSQAARVFDDSVSEYLVFRYFFDDTSGSLSFARDVLEPYGALFGDRILENLDALTRSGYTSTKLERLLAELPQRAAAILFGEADENIKLRVLQPMQKYAVSAPDECFALIEKYTRLRGVEVVPAEQASAIMEIAYRTPFRAYSGEIVHRFRAMASTWSAKQDWHGDYKSTGRHGHGHLHGRANFAL